MNTSDLLKARQTVIDSLELHIGYLPPWMVTLIDDYANTAFEVGRSAERASETSSGDYKAAR